MARTRGDPVVQFVRKLAAAKETAQLADRALLERFIDCRDEAAFAALVRRHGPMVLRLCSRVLLNEADAEDAFQATFLTTATWAGTRRR